jgi:hypothetical protein
MNVFDPSTADAHLLALSVIPLGFEGLIYLRQYNEIFNVQGFVSRVAAYR